MPRIKLTIMDREYPFEVSEEDVENLRSAAEILNTRASQVRSANRSLTPERVAVMASLQIAFDSLESVLSTPFPPLPTPARARISEALPRITEGCKAKSP